MKSLATVLAACFIFLTSAAAMAASATLAAGGPTGATMPDLDIRMLSGERVVFPAAPGVVTLLVLWSPDSLASRKSISELDRFHAAYADRVRVIAATTLTDESRVRAYLHDNRLRFPVGLLQNTSSRLPADEQLPIIYFMDEAGELRATHAGLFRFGTLERGVQALLGTAGER